MRLRRKKVSTADLSPATELDSLVRDLFTRVVKQHDGPILLDYEDANRGFVHWEFADLNGKTVVNLWYTETADA